MNEQIALDENSRKSYWLGRKRGSQSEEHKNKNRFSHFGKKQSKETREKKSMKISNLSVDRAIVASTQK